MNKKNMAVLGITDEIIVDRYDNKRYKVIFIVSNNEDSVIPPFRKFSEDEMRRAVPGKYFEDDRLFGHRMIFPRREDFLSLRKIRNNFVETYKLWHYGIDYFSDGEKEVYLSLVKEVTTLAKHRLVLPSKMEVYCFVQSLFHGVRSVGKTQGKRVKPDTPCHDFFHADVDGVDHCIARPIEERFGLERFGVTYGLVHHSYRTIERNSSFYKKYPQKSIGTTEFTLHRFCAMVYDLVRMRHGLPPL